MNESASIGFLSERDEYARLPDMIDKRALSKFAAKIAAQLWSQYEALSDAWADAHGGKDMLFTDEAQAAFIRSGGRYLRALSNFTPMYWQKIP